MTGTQVVSAINDPATSGTIADNRLSNNVARLNAPNAWTGNNTFTGNQSVTGNVSASGSLSSLSLSVDMNTLSVNSANHRVGIGTANPQQTLSVYGALNIDQGNTNTGTVASALTFGSGSGEGIASRRMAGNNQYGLDFYTASQNRLSITQQGRIGFGTNTPAAKLDIVAGANNDGVGDPVAMAFQWNSGGYRHFIRTRHNAALGSGNAIDFFVNNSATNTGSSAPGVGSLHVMTLDSGRVGVGTQTPAFKLHVVDAGNSGLRVENAGSGGTIASFGGSGDFNVDAVGTTGRRLTVKENGNVGIGTANPSDKLSVAGNVSAAGYKFADGTVQATAVGATYTAYRNTNQDVPPVGQPEVSFAHLDLPAGNYEINATISLDNQAALAFQDNTRIVLCTVGSDVTYVTLPAPTQIYTMTVLNVHTVKILGQAGGVDLTCRANNGGTDTSYVYSVSRRLTATRVAGVSVQ